MHRRAKGRARLASGAPVVAVAGAAAGLAATAAAWAGGGGALDLPWAPTLGLRLSFRLDGIGALYALLATGIGLAVLLYSRAYVPRHLEHQERPRAEQTSFYGWMALFMLAMVGLATAQDLILLFVFWDLTAIASYFLIAYDRHERESRVAALMALLVTGVTGVLLLIGALLLFGEYGTFSLPELFERAEPGWVLTVAGALIGAAAVAKSAQVPFHFWLPQAMRAPTPVSAYLHSAAMVAAGVLLLGRVYPLIEGTAVLLDALLVVGFLSMAVGGLLALTRDDLKQLLAYSTFAQYGYVVVLYGLGGPVGAIGAAFYVVGHALSKSALFLTAGAVTEATGGRSRLSELGGLARSMPLVAAASGAAAAGVAALPLTAGFFADELFFKAAAERGTVWVVLTTAGAALTLAYMARFWSGIFLGRPRARARPIPSALVLPVVALAAMVVAGGLVPSPVTGLSEAAGEATLARPAAAEVAYHLDARAENLMALAAYAAGALILLASTGALRRALGAVARGGERLGPERAYHGGLRILNAASDRIHALEVRDLRTRVASVLLPAGILVLAALSARPSPGHYSIGTLPLDEVVLAAALLLAALAGLAATRVRRHVSLVLAVAMVGYALAAVYALFGAPDLALVAVLVETLFALLFFGVFALMQPRVLEREAALKASPRRLRRSRLVAVVSGGLVFVLAWGALSTPAPQEGVAQAHMELAPDAHADNVVTAVLADFRALDTLGEITVLAIALAGVAALMRRGRLT